MIDRKRWMENQFSERLTPEAVQVMDLLPEHIRNALFHAAEGLYNTGHQDALSAIGTGRYREFYVPDEDVQGSVVAMAFPHEVA